MTAKNDLSTRLNLSVNPDYYWPLVIIVLSLLISIVINKPVYLHYAVQGDNYPLILHSSRFFEVSPYHWFIDGFRYYLSDYPEVFTDPSYFIRPTQNILVYVISFFAKSPNSYAFILPYYIGHACCCAFVYLFCRLSVLRFSLKNALTAALLFAGSASTWKLFLYAPVFGGDMLGALFGMAAFLLSCWYVNPKYKHNRVLLSSVVILLMLAVFAKETAVVWPIIVAVYVCFAKLNQENVLSPPIKFDLIFSIIQKNWMILIVLITPSVIYIVYIIMLRLLLGAGAAAYVFDTDLLRMMLRPVYASLILFAPPGESILKLINAFLGEGYYEFWALLRDSAAILLNLSSNLIILILIYQKRIDIKIGLLSILFAIAMLIPAFLAPHARLLYTSQLFAIPLFLCLVDKISFPRYSTGLVILFICLHPIYTFFVHLPQMQPAIVASFQQSKQFQDVLRTELEDPQIKRIYALNTAGGYGSLAQLEFVTALANRNELVLRVVNSVRNHDRVDPNIETSKDKGVKIETQANELIVRINLDPNKQFFFPNIGKTAYSKLGVAGLISYEFEALAEESDLRDIKSMIVSIPNVSANNILLIGYEFHNKNIHVWKSTHPNWRMVIDDGGGHFRE